MIHGAGTRPHRPVEFVFKKVKNLYAWTFATPAGIPATRPFGPHPAPTSWDGPLAASRLAVDLARSAPWEQAKSALDAAYRVFAGAAEVCLSKAAGVELRQAGVRGLPPRPVWKPVMRHRAARGLAGEKRHIYEGWRTLSDDVPRRPASSSSSPRTGRDSPPRLTQPSLPRVALGRRLW